MARENIDQRRDSVRRILSAGLEIKGREAKVLSVLFGCSVSAIKSDAKVVRADAIRPSSPENASGELIH